VGFLGNPQYGAKGPGDEMGENKNCNNFGFFKISHK